MRITRPRHALIGQEADVLMGGARFLTVRVVNGARLRIRRDWTDADGPSTSNPYEGFGGDRVFTADALRALLEVVDALRRD